MSMLAQTQLRSGLAIICVVVGAIDLASMGPMATLSSGILLVFSGLFYWYSEHKLHANTTASPGKGGPLANESTTQAKAKRKPNNALTVLVIEDNPATRRLYELRIAYWKFPVSLHVVSNGYEGLVLTGEIEPDLLICDLRLPEVDGVQVVTALCNLDRYKDMAIIMVTGLPFASIDARGGVPDRVEKFGKPIDFDQLEKTAQEIWSRKTGS